MSAMELDHSKLQLILNVIAITAVTSLSMIWYLRKKDERQMISQLSPLHDRCRREPEVVPSVPPSEQAAKTQPAQNVDTRPAPDQLELNQLELNTLEPDQLEPVQLYPGQPEPVHPKPIHSEAARQELAMVSLAWEIEKPQAEPIGERKLVAASVALPGMIRSFGARQVKNWSAPPVPQGNVHPKSLANPRPQWLAGDGDHYDLVPPGSQRIAFPRQYPNPPCVRHLAAAIPINDNAPFGRTIANLAQTDGCQALEFVASRRDRSETA